MIIEARYASCNQSMPNLLILLLETCNTNIILAKKTDETTQHSVERIPPPHCGIGGKPTVLFYVYIFIPYLLHCRVL